MTYQAINILTIVILNRELVGAAVVCAAIGAVLFLVGRRMNADGEK